MGSFSSAAEPQPLTPWPAPTPAPTVDFTPLQQQLGAIADELRHNQLPQGPDPQVLQALQAHRADAEQLKNEVPKQIDAAVKPVSEKVGTIEATVKPLLALHEKLEADAQAGGLKGKLAQQVLDASEGGEDAAAKIHKELFIVLAVLAVLAVIAFGVIHLVKTGHGPLGQVLDKLAAASPPMPLCSNWRPRSTAWTRRLLQSSTPLAPRPLWPAEIYQRRRPMPCSRSKIISRHS